MLALGHPTKSGGIFKGLKMDKLFTIIVGGSLVGFMGLIGVVGVSSGFVFQGVMVGALALLFGGMILALLVD
jgi:hypothetical protein